MPFRRRFPVRMVAIFFVALFVAAPLAIGAPGDGRHHGQNDMCPNEIFLDGSKPSCLRIDLDGTSATVTDRTGPSLFLWLGDLGCDEALCHLPDRTPSKNIVTGSSGLFGILYGDTNGVPGLQRILIGGTPPDGVLLV